MKMRPPAVPIINLDPYFSMWTEHTDFSRVMHWTGMPNTLVGSVTVDGAPWYFLGHSAVSQEKNVLDFARMEIDGFSTVMYFTNSFLEVKVHFTSPVLPDSLYYASRPVGYCKVSCRVLDGKEHTISVRFSASEELVLNQRGEGRVGAEPVSIDGLTAIRMGNLKQQPLSRCGDNLRIDWGYFYMGFRGSGSVGQQEIDGMFGIYGEKPLEESEALFFFAYDDVYSVQYFGKHLQAYWKKDGKTITQAISEAVEEYDCLLEKCNGFSKKMYSQAVRAGNEKYAEMLLLSLRQIMAAHKLVVNEQGENLYISKECFSCGASATVDVTYPSSPFFMLYNTELLKGMIRPVMAYANSPEWDKDYAPHDIGYYPHLDGQIYGVIRSAPVVIQEHRQMPVEECGNLLILFAAICKQEGTAAFAEPHLNTLEKWSNYLIQYGLDPENQLCTDDFAGHLAHNVNLSIKAIMGLAGYSLIQQQMGNAQKAQELMQTARQYAQSVVERAKNEDGSCRLAYDLPGTFSLKYNAIWDLIWDTKLFPGSFFDGELTRYEAELLPYGVPLDSREKYTKSDWTVWVASMAKDKEHFCKLTDPLWSAYNTMRTYVPMTDWFYCDTSHMVAFRHRSVQGGLFIKLMMSE